MTTIVLLGTVLAGCGARGIARVQQAHGHEFACDPRYVRVERREGDRWVSRGCAFEADWTCPGGECELLDARTHGVGAP